MDGPQGLLLEAEGQREHDAAEWAKDVEDLQHPDHHVDDDDTVEQRLDARGHGDVAVDKAEQNADDEQPDDYGKQQWVNRHVYPRKSWETLGALGLGRVDYLAGWPVKRKMVQSSSPVEPYSFCSAISARSARWSPGLMEIMPLKSRVKAGLRSRTEACSALT